MKLVLKLKTFNFVNKNKVNLLSFYYFFSNRTVINMCNCSSSF
jgi:hypothetical protein